MNVMKRQKLRSILGALLLTFISVSRALRPEIEDTIALIDRLGAKEFEELDESHSLRLEEADSNTLNHRLARLGSSSHRPVPSPYSMRDEREGAPLKIMANRIKTFHRRISNLGKVPTGNEQSPLSNRFHSIALAKKKGAIKEISISSRMHMMRTRQQAREADLEFNRKEVLQKYEQLAKGRKVQFTPVISFFQNSRKFRIDISAQSYLGRILTLSMRKRATRLAISRVTNQRKAWQELKTEFPNYPKIYSLLNSAEAAAGIEHKVVARLIESGALDIDVLRDFKYQEELEKLKVEIDQPWLTLTEGARLDPTYYHYSDGDGKFRGFRR